MFPNSTIYGHKIHLCGQQLIYYGFLTLFAMFISIRTNAQADPFVVSGTIVDNKGESLPGVSVKVKGTGRATTSRNDGKYSISAKTGEMLVFSYLGFEVREIRVGTSHLLNVTLAEQINELNDVVVVGYGTMKRASLTTAQTSIKAADIEKTVNTTFDQALQGRAAGVLVTSNSAQPGGSLSVNIRGVSTINGTNEPLYVIDGVQIQPELSDFGITSSANPLAGLNPSDIETMEVLQGPSATAIFGSRGTNGVVMITTKRGKSGETRVSYDLLYSVQDRPDLLPVMDLKQYATMMNDVRDALGDPRLPEFNNPSILGVGSDWQSSMYRRVPLAKHQVTVSGGTDKTRFYLAGEYFDQEGIAYGSSFNRYSMRLNLDNQTRKWLKIGTNISFNQTREELAATEQSIIRVGLSQPPNMPIFNADGTWGGPAEGEAPGQGSENNPIAMASIIDNNQQKKQLLASANATISILKGLEFRTSLNGNAGMGKVINFTPTYKLGNYANTVAELSKQSSENFYWNWNQLLEYTMKVKQHGITLMISHEAQASTYEGIGGLRRGFVTNDLPELNLGDPQGMTNTSYRGHWAMESYFGRLNYSFRDKYFLQAAYRADGSVNFGPQNRWGYFPSVSAAWRLSKEPFMKKLTFISDLKLRLETGLTGNQGSGADVYAPLSPVETPWGAGFITVKYGNEDLQWEETRTDNVGFNIGLLKNRIQIEGDFYKRKTENLLMPNPLPNYMGTAGSGAIESPTVNIGALQNHGFAFSLNTININNRRFKWSTSFNISRNVNEVLKFYSDAATADRTNWAAPGLIQRSQPGSSAWLFYGYVYDGLFQSVEEIQNSAIPVRNGVKIPISTSGVWVGDVKYKDLNGDGIIDTQDQTFIGNPWPKFSIGFTNNFSYKNLSVSMLITGSYGNDVFNNIRYTNLNPAKVYARRNLLQEAFGYARLGTDDAGNVVLKNPGTTVPRYSAGALNGNFDRATDYFVEDGSFLRIKNLTVNYQLPKKFLSLQNVVQAARIGAGVQNLLTLTNYSGYDPEVGADVGKNSQPSRRTIGVDVGKYPSTRMYNFNIGVTF
ncbi:SusC/RagA family TonB-linked outer membrane protein [Desertivirga xinjiangensis]|uniref:SusC/RagA family TonB-linked outer membrane protein n=1 Tax=Desertivirga xinjiangensis TaxID=539206 RepID=UPI002109EA33|nr:TonB-dependent receptor [Pedobacter xinjiangensis]